MADLSAGVTFGVKLPTGNDNYSPAIVDRDTQIGSGSTDILLGGFYRDNLDRNQKWDWFAQLQLDVPVLIQAQYRPGVELDTAAGIDYKGWSLGRVKISPVAQVIFSERTSDSGAAANSDNSGYQRILLSPGVEFHMHPVKIYADAEFPVFQNFHRQPSGRASAVQGEPELYVLIFTSGTGHRQGRETRQAHRDHNRQGFAVAKLSPKDTISTRRRVPCF